MKVQRWKLLTEEEGQDLIEYALLAALLSLISFAALTNLGPVVSDVWPRFTTILSSV